MYRYLLLITVGLIAIVCSSCAQTDPRDMSEEELVTYAREVHERVISIDTHIDIPSNYATDEVDPGVNGRYQVDIPKMEEGGLDAVFLVVFAGQAERTPENYEAAKAEALNKFAAIHRLTEEMYPDRIELAYTPDDVERISSSGKLIACIGIENGFVIGKDLSLLEDYYERGARYMTLTHGGHNDIGDSSTPRDNLDDLYEEHRGLSAFGEDVVAEMNRLGMMVDVSHVSKKTMLDAVRLSKAPIIASHSGTTHYADVARNLDDEQLLALKENGGVMQTVALGSYVKVDPPEKVAAMNELRQEMGITSYAAYRNMTEEERNEYRRRAAEFDEQWPRANVQDFVNHIDYAVELIGIDHVGIGSDFDGGGGVVGWSNASETFNVTLELVRRGYSESDISKIWGGNLLRVWREVNRVAADLQAGME